MTALRAYADSLAANGVAAIKHWIDRIAEVRMLAARLINAPDPHDVYFVPNTTHGIGVIAEGFPWQAGRQCRARGGRIPREPVPVDEPRHPRRRSAERPEPRKPGRTSTTFAARWIAAPECSQSPASSSPAGSATTSMRSANSAANAVSSSSWTRFSRSGVFPLDVQKTPIDALAADGHKWMLGPEGAGIGYIRREWVERLHPIGVGAFSVVRPLEFTTIDFTLKPHAGRWEGGALQRARHRRAWARALNCC